MGQYLLRRLLISIPILFGLTLLSFVLAEIMPGDYVDSMIPPDVTRRASPEQLANMRENLGLDKPATVRYFLWLRQVFTGNLGYSLASGESVLREIGQRLPATLELTVTALVFSLVGGTTLGILSAIKQHSWLDQFLTVLAFIWISTPGFVFAIGGIVLFSLKLHVLPTSGMESYGESSGLLDRLHHLVLPATVLGLSGVASFMRYARASLLDVIRHDYITVARAKGLREQIVLLRHALRNALIPLITIIGLELPGLLGGAIIIESIFGWPGMGTYALVAITSRDYPVIMGVNFIAALLVLTSNLLTDIVYGVVDPRMRLLES